MTKTSNRRERMRGDRAWLARARAHFCNLLRKWAESPQDPHLYRERVWAIADAMIRHGLLSKSGCCLGHSVCVHWRRQDGVWWGPWVDSDPVRRRVALMLPRGYRQWCQMRRQA